MTEYIEVTKLCCGSYMAIQCNDETDPILLCLHCNKEAPLAKPSVSQVSPELDGWPVGLTPDIARHMVALITTIADAPQEGYGNEARAIMAELEPPVDPLNAVFDELPCNFAGCVDASERFREALAKHGLTISKEG